MQTLNMFEYLDFISVLLSFSFFLFMIIISRKLRKIMLKDKR